MHHTGIRPDGLRKIADNLDLVADEYDRAGHPKHESVLRNNSAVLRRMANRIVQLETQMGRADKDITELRTALAAERHGRQVAEQKRDAAIQNAYDTSDIAAMDAYEKERDATAAGGSNGAAVTVGADTNTANVNLPAPA